MRTSTFRFLISSGSTKLLGRYSRFFGTVRFFFSIILDLSRDSGAACHLANLTPIRSTRPDSRRTVHAGSRTCAAWVLQTLKTKKPVDFEVRAFERDLDGCRSGAFLVAQPIMLHSCCLSIAGGNLAIQFKRRQASTRVSGHVRAHHVARYTASRRRGRLHRGRGDRRRTWGCFSSSAGHDRV